MTYTEIIKDQTNRSISSLANVISCIDNEDWDRAYCRMPIWKHIYHTLHSLDQWYINPHDYLEPSFHEPNLNNLDVKTDKTLTRQHIEDYLNTVNAKILYYLSNLTEEMLLEQPPNCSFTRFHLILAQHRHLDMHIGMLMGFMIADTGKWPWITGIDTPLESPHPKFFE